MLPILFPDTERQHLVELARGGAGHTGSHALRTELRRLRSVGLIANKPNRSIAEIEDGKTVEISQIVALTRQGKFWVERIQAMELTRAEGEE
jgi:hypothetical protein